jgi:uncharacterized alkaline shock family protein YloU
MHDPFKQIDKKELELPDTIFIRDIESKVFQSIIVRCIEHIEGVETLEGSLFDSLLGRDSLDVTKGIHVEQDQKNHAVNIKVEVNVAYGTCISEKAEEIQAKIVEDVSHLTGLHVGRVHIIFKNLITIKQGQDLEETMDKHIKRVKQTSSLDKYDEHL